MAQKVKIYPLNSFGGRIQALMKKNEMTIVDLYLEMTGKSESDLPKYEYGDSNNNTAYHQVKNWLNEKGIDKKKLERLCEIFNVSADYLLGTDTEVNDTLQAIHDYTGLSSEAIEVLRTYNKGDNARLFNLILQQDNGLGMIKAVIAKPSVLPVMSQLDQTVDRKARVPFCSLKRRHDRVERGLRRYGGHERFRHDHDQRVGERDHNTRERAAGGGNLDFRLHTGRRQRKSFRQNRGTDRSFQWHAGRDHERLKRRRHGLLLQDLQL